MLDLNILWLNLDALMGKWRDIRDDLRLASGDFEEGRMHAYNDALNNYDDLAALGGETEMECQINELINKCETAPTGYSEYGRGYKVGMGECGEDLRTLLADTLG